MAIFATSYSATRKKFLMSGLLLLVGLFAAMVRPAHGLVPPVVESAPDFVPYTMSDASAAACANSDYAVSAADSGRRQGTGQPVRPPNPAGPTFVDVGLFVMELSEINIVANNYRMEAFVDLVWCDPRLAFDPLVTGYDREIYLEHLVPTMLNEIWWPDYEFVNEVGSRAIENDALIIYPDGTVHYEERLNVVLAANYDLRRFPFDQQTLPVVIESFYWDSDYLVFQQQNDKVGFSSEFEIAEWTTETVTSSLRERQEIRDPIPFSSMTVELVVKRQSGFYIWKIFLPLLLMVAISCTVFWMTGEGLPSRMSVSLTGLLTIVAYQFVIAGSLPRVSYLTLMDAFLVLCIGLIGMAVFESVAVYLMSKREQSSRAATMDKVSRWAFPLTCSIGLLLMLSRYFI